MIEYKPFNVINDIIIPNYGPLNIRYSRWELYRSKELLAANGFDNNENEWRKATLHSNGLIRATAYFLLTRNIKQQNTGLFRVGIDDIDETAQAFCAFGLYKSGDEPALKKLMALANQDVEAHISAIQAAGLLGQLGFPTAFKTIQMALKSRLEYVQVFGIQNAVFFVPLNESIYDFNNKIDIWAIYRQALKNNSSNVRTIAIAQLNEINSKESQELLQNLNK